MALTQQPPGAIPASPSDPASGATSPRAYRLVTFLAQSRAGRCAGITADAAWMLTHAGYRVLILDLGHTAATRGFGGFSVAPYLRPFPSVPRGDLRDHLGAVVEPGHQLRHQPVSHLFPGPSGAVDLATVEPTGPASGGAVDLSALDRELAALRYDYVLINCPVDPVQGEPDPVVGRGDLAVVCFASAEAASRQARSLAHRLETWHTGAIPLIGAVTYQLVGDPHRLAQRRREIREAFTRQPTGGIAAPGTPEVVELLDRRGNADRPVLSVLFEEQSGTGATEGYHALLAAVSDYAVTRVPETAAIVRQRYRQRVSGDPAAQREQIRIGYPPHQLGWAEWVADQLRLAGADAELLPGHSVEPPASLILIGEEEEFAPPVRTALRNYRDRAPVGAAPEEFAIRFSATPATEPRVLRLAVDDSAEAGARLLAQYLLHRPTTPESGEPHRDDQRWHTRYPGHHSPRLTERMPPLDRDFVGRDRELAQVRHGLRQHRVQLVTGPAAVGKTEIAREYANRFAFDYDVVWWFPARNRPELESSHLLLTEQLNHALITTGKGELGPRALSAFRAGDGPRRWLLIFDGADDPDTLAGLLPLGGSGHILITAREQSGFDELLAGVTAAEPVEVSVMDGAEGVRLLTRRHQLVSREQASRLVDRLGGEPLALRLAAQTLRARVGRLRGDGMTGAQAVDEAASTYLAALPEPPASRIGAALAAAELSLADDGLGTLALWLSRMCGFLSPEGASLRLVRSSGFVSRLAELAGPAGELVTNDAMKVDQAVWVGARSGLFHVDWNGAELVIHREMQRLVVESLPAADRARVWEATCRALAAYAPSDAEVEVGSQVDRLSELGRHLLPSRAAESPLREVRRWLVIQIQHLARYGAAEARRHANELADTVSTRWAADPSRDADLRLRLDGERARLQLALQHYHRAAAIQLEVIDRYRELVGTDHVRTLVASRNAGRYLRALGKFPEAQSRDHFAHEGLLRALGADHPNTQRSANSVALSAFLAGDVDAAVEILDRLVRRAPDQPGSAEGDSAWRYAANLGFYLREQGSYPRARQVLLWAQEGARGRGDLEGRTFELRIRRDLALIHRWSGEPHIAHASDARSVERYLSLFGPQHPETLAAQLALAADELDLARQRQQAAGLVRARHAAEGFQAVLPDDHPYVALCHANLSAFLLAAGELDPAEEAATQARQRLTDRLGGQHPWTLAAANNHLAALAHPTAVADRSLIALAENLAERCEEYLTATHPFTRVIEANRARLAAKDPPEPVRPLPIIVDIPPS